MGKASLISTVLTAGMFVIVAVIFGVILDSVITPTASTYNQYDTFTDVVLNGTVTLSQNPVVAGSEVVLRAGGGTYVRDTNYTISNPTGVITLINTNGTGNVTYRYTTDQYINEGTTRSFIVYIPTLVLLSVLVYLGFQFVLRKGYLK